MSFIKIRRRLPSSAWQTR